MNIVVLRRLFDVGERQVPVLIRHAGHLIEAGQGIFDMAPIGQRFLALLWERENAFRQVVSIESVFSSELLDFKSLLTVMKRLFAGLARSRLAPGAAGLIVVAQQAGRFGL